MDKCLHMHQSINGVQEGMLQCRSHMCTEQLIYDVSALSKLQGRTEISAVRYTNLIGIVA